MGDCVVFWVIQLVEAEDQLGATKHKLEDHIPLRVYYRDQLEEFNEIVCDSQRKKTRCLAYICI